MQPSRRKIRDALRPWNRRVGAWPWVLEQAEAAIVEIAEAGRKLPWVGAPVQHCKVQLMRANTCSDEA